MTVMEEAKPKAFRKPNYTTYQEPILDDEFITKVMNYLRLGAYIETAVIVAGASKDSFYRWMKIANGKFKPKPDEGPPSPELVELCIKLRNSVDIAGEECTMRDLQVIDNAANGKATVYERYPKGFKDHETGEDLSGQLVLDGKGKPIVVMDGLTPNWNAAAWRLQKRRSKEWGSSAGTEIKDKTQNNIEIEFVDVDDEVDDEE